MLAVQAALLYLASALGGVVLAAAGAELLGSGTSAALQAAGWAPAVAAACLPLVACGPLLLIRSRRLAASQAAAWRDEKRNSTEGWGVQISDGPLPVAR